MLLSVRVCHENVDLGAVEGAVAGGEGPGYTGGVERLRECVFGAVPFGGGADVVVGAGGEYELVLGEMQYGVDSVDEAQGG